MIFEPIIATQDLVFGSMIITELISVTDQNVVALFLHSPSSLHLVKNSVIQYVENRKRALKLSVEGKLDGGIFDHNNL